MRNQAVLFYKLLTISLLLLTGCGKKEDVILPANPEKLLGNWVLISPKTGYDITLRIEPSVNNTMLIPPKPLYAISGKGPVNQYSSSLTYAADSTSSARWIPMRWIRIGQPFATTEIAENEDQAKIAADYLRRLGDSYTYEVTEGGQLRLYYIAPWSSAKPVAGDDGMLIYQHQ